MRPWGIKRLFSFPSRTREEVRADVDDELAFHLEMRTAALEQEGSNRRDARERALAELGRTDGVFASLATIGERHERKRRLSRVFDDVWRDVVIGCRLLRRSPGFAATATSLWRSVSARTPRSTACSMPCSCVRSRTPNRIDW